MTYSRQIVLKNGNTALLRNAEPSDAGAVLENFSLTHAETDYLLTYPDESTFDAEREACFLQRKAESANEIEIIAVADGRVVATAGVDAVGTRDKLRHRAEFGVSVLRAYWGLGLGRALTEASIQCAKEAGYEQLERPSSRRTNGRLRCTGRRGLSNSGAIPADSAPGRADTRRSFTCCWRCNGRPSCISA